MCCDNKISFRRSMKFHPCVVWLVTGNSGVCIINQGCRCIVCHKLIGLQAWGQIARARSHDRDMQHVPSSILSRVTLQRVTWSDSLGNPCLRHGSRDEAVSPFARNEVTGDCIRQRYLAGSINTPDTLSKDHQFQASVLLTLSQSCLTNLLCNIKSSLLRIRLSKCPRPSSTLLHLLLCRSSRRPIPLHHPTRRTSLRITATNPGPGSSPPTSLS